jgi:hypothetical protein
MPVHDGADADDAARLPSTLHIPSASEGSTSGRRGILSPATVVHIKQVFGKSSDRAQSGSRALEDWQQLRPTSVANATQTSEQSGPHGSGILANGRGSVLSNSQNSTVSILPSPKLVEEPASYLNSPVDPAIQGVQAEDTDSDDSHSGDEYTHLNVRRKTIRKAASTEFRPNKAYQGRSRLEAILDIFRLPNLTAQQRGILKCSIAYFCATLFTFVPYLSDLFAAPFDLEGAPVAGAHVIATVATYYNPAKTLGAMFEADIFMLWASLFAFIACLGSMTTAVVLNDLGLHDTSHVVVVGAWLVGSMGLLAWMKVKVSNAQFGSACSMVALIVWVRSG